MAHPGADDLINEILLDADDQPLALSLGIATDGARSETPTVRSQRLSPRELEVLSLVAGGMSNNAIARHLYISEATVKVHLRHIFEKLGVRSRTQAALHPAARRARYATSDTRSATSANRRPF
jgi:DNA-binding NarL/FixJ family response regulator